MCGIAGVLQLFQESDPADELHITTMVNLLAHRGPDDVGIERIGPCTLGHCRLSVIDLTSAGHQPMSDEHGLTWITYNGEVYNFKELRREHNLDSRGCTFRSRTDTEVVLNLYRHLGIEFSSLLNGMFAFAIWDTKSSSLHLVRDPFGIKPLFYLQTKNKFWFASEIKALLSVPGFERKPSPAALYHFLSLNYVPGAHTAFTDIHELRPGHILSIRPGDRVPTVRPFFHWKFPVDDHPSEQENTVMLHRILKESVERHLFADVPVGVMLSGGLDSSALTAMTARIRGSDFNTFALSFEEQDYNEADFAHIVASHYGTQHHEIPVTAQKVGGMLPNYLAYIDEPYADGSAIPTYLLAEEAANYVVVLLSGEGGDELFAGYDTHTAFKMRHFYRLIPGFIRHNIIKPAVDRMPVSYSKLSLDFKAKRFVHGSELDIPESHFFWRIVLNEEIKRKVMIDYDSVLQTEGQSHELFSDAYYDCKAGDDLNRLLCIDSRYHLPDDLMIKNDRMTMAHSLEARVPFTDALLVHFMMQVPVGLKMHGLKRKYILRNALNGLLPKQVINKKKVGLEIPYSKWMRKEWRELVDATLDSKRLSETGLFNAKAVRTLLEDHWAGRADHGRPLWGLMNYMMWHNLYIETARFKDYLKPPRPPRKQEQQRNRLMR